MTSFRDERFDVPQTDIGGEIEKTNYDLFHEFEDMPDEAINYVDELETQIRKAKEELKFIREAMQVSGKMTFYINKITNVLNVLK